MGTEAEQADDTVSEPRYWQLEKDLDAVATKVRTLQHQVLVLHKRQKEQDTAIAESVADIRTTLDKHLNEEALWRAHQDKSIETILTTLDVIKVTIVGDAVTSVNRWQMSYKVFAVAALALSAILLILKQDKIDISAILGWLK